MPEDFMSRQRKIEFFNSKGFKIAEARRINESKPNEHVYIDDEGMLGRVYCPEEDKIRPAWLCAQQHGDYDSRTDEDQERED